MKTSARTALPLLFALLFVAPAFAGPLAVVVNKKNKVDNMGSDYFEKLIRTTQGVNWPEGIPTVLVLHAHSPAEDRIFERLLKLDAPHWKALRAANPDWIQTANTDAGVLKIVRSIPGGIGLVSPASVNKTVNVVMVDGFSTKDSDYPLK
jgi:ABC-type phosphate transport system substrate-binding protein